MAARVRGSCNKEQEIKNHLGQVLVEARNIAFEVVRLGANFLIRLKANSKQVPITAMVKQVVSDAIAHLTKKLKLRLCEHKCDGFIITYKLATS